MNNILDLNSMSTEELKKLSKSVESQMKKLDRSKKELLIKKKQYHMVSVIPECEVDYRYLYQKLYNYFLAHDKLSSSQFLEICRESLYEAPVYQSDIYPCPECGELSLYVGEYEDVPNRTTSYAIICSHCDFTCPNETEYIGDAWDIFHKWLVKNRYLDK